MPGDANGDAPYPAAPLAVSFRQPHDALREFIRAVRRVERHATEIAARPELQVVKIRLRPPVGADDMPVRRQRGRPPGVRNGTGGTVTLYATGEELATLRATLRQ